MNKTSLSAGRVVARLIENGCGGYPVYPCISPVEATLPYIVYFRTGLETASHKPQGVADTCEIAVRCYAAEYDESVAMAEDVRESIEGMQGTTEGLRLRCAELKTSTECWADDAYCQQLSFILKFN